MLAGGGALGHGAGGSIGWCISWMLLCVTPLALLQHPRYHLRDIRYWCRHVWHRHRHVLHRKYLSRPLACRRRISHIIRGWHLYFSIILSHVVWLICWARSAPMTFYPKNFSLIEALCRASSNVFGNFSEIAGLCRALKKCLIAIFAFCSSWRYK